MIKLTDVFAAVNETLLASFENIKVYKERINNLSRPDMSVELITFRTSPHSRQIINKSIDLDIIFFSKENRVGEALVVADRLMSAFSMGLFVRAYDKDGKIIDKRHLHCLKFPEYKLVDQDLHFLVKFDFADEFDPYYLADDKTIKSHNDKLDPGQIDRKEPWSNNVIDNRDFVEDVKFESEEKKKDYEDERIKLMHSLKLDYEIMEV